ncbi:hypothetical protein SAMN02990966_05323 [Rhodospirillales bacterium URHD0017]|nr:hypothetical protein SAMN02990966_05323 [Rhodospirillales bacterium URHD0017]
MVRFLKFSLWFLMSAFVTGQASAQVNVTVQNQQSQTIYVAFTLGAGQVPGTINWGNCASSASNNQVAIGPGASCNAVVPTASSSSRLCASTSSMGTTPNCYNAQTNHQTMVETTFGSFAQGCYPTSMASCVWYDISLIPAQCTDALWQSQNYCSNTGGAAYNLPVQLSCQGQPTYTCQGPPANTYGNSGYPGNCGNPNATCSGNSQNCVVAYFHPMFVPPYSQYQPNAQCPAGSTLQVTFLAGR